MLHFGIEFKVATTLLGSNSQVHDLCTATHGSFRKWFKWIRQLQKNHLKFRIGVVKVPQNIRDMKNIETFLRKNRLIQEKSQFIPDHVRPTGRGEIYFKSCKNKAQDELFLNISERFFKISRHWNPCWGGLAAVLSDGEVIPCVFSRNMSVGNIKKEGFGDLVNKLKKRYWSITLDSIKKCGDCELRYACTDCRALSVNLGMGLFGKSIECSYNPY